MDLQLGNNNYNNTNTGTNNKKYKASRSKIKHFKTTQDNLQQSKWEKTLQNINSILNDITEENKKFKPVQKQINNQKEKVVTPQVTQRKTHTRNNSRISYTTQELLQLAPTKWCKPTIQYSTPLKLIRNCGNRRYPTSSCCNILKKNAPDQKNYNIMHLNTGGLSPETVTELNHQIVENDIDVLCLNETKLQPHRDLTLYGYQCIARRDRPRTGRGVGGGVAIYAKIGTKIEQITFQTNEEIVMAEMTTNRNNKINIVSYYNPPHKDLNTAEIRRAANQNRKTLVLGDLNAKHTELNNRSTNNSGTLLKHMLDNESIMIINDAEPTHMDPRGSTERIDLALATIPLLENIRNFSVCELYATHGHAPIITSLTFDRDREQNHTTGPAPYNYDKADWHKFKETIHQKLPDDIHLNNKTQVDQAVNTVIKTIQEAADANIPRLQRRKYRPSLPAWIGTLIKNRHRARRRHQRLKTHLTRRLYNAATAAVKKAIKDHKQDQWDNITRKLENQKDPRKFWPLFKKLTKRRMPIEYGKLRNPQNGTKPENGKEIAQIFTNQLHEIMNRPTPNIMENQTHNHVNEWFRQNLNELKPLNHTEHRPVHHTLLENISENEVKDAIKRFPPRKAPGPDGLQMIVYKGLPVAAIKILTKIYNAAIKLGYFPKQFKVAKVIMLPKPNKPKDNPKNFRPISLTNTIGKIFERIIHTRISHHLTNIQFFSTNQHGFKAKSGAADQIVRVLHQIKEEHRTRNSPLLIALDLEKAFDKVWHKGLIYKFSRIPGIPAAYHRLITSFLYQRKIYTTVQGENSESFTPKAGVPQGSILSPLLFNIYVNDIQELNTPSKTHIYQYADDTCILTSARNKDHHTLETKANQTLSLLQKYFDNWKLKANPEKTQLIAATLKRPVAIKREVKITFAGTDIPFAPSLTLLGNIIKPTLNMTDHIKHIKAKATRAINKLKVLNSATTNISSKTADRLYKSLVRSIMEYCPQYTLLATDAQIHTLQQSQNRALRQAIGAHYYVPNSMVREIFTDTPPLKDRLEKLAKSYINKTQNTDVRQIINQIEENPRRIQSHRSILYDLIHTH